MYISEDTIRDIRSKTDIVDVIGDVVLLQKKGKSFLGLCPFHTEKTPSFNVNKEIGIYKCFGCGKSGDSITFLMEHNGVNFVDAVKLLATRAGITIETENLSSVDAETEYQRMLLYKALDASAQYYSQQLETKEGQAVLRYFHDRGLRDSTITEYGLGYAPDSWNKTLTELIHQGFTKETLEKAGLIIVRDDTTSYDRFRQRAMFAIHDSFGKIVGYGARILKDENGQPKYINSPQSDLYDKSTILYGLYHAKHAIRKEDCVLMVEGYMDVLTLHQSGYKHTVATSGTSLTEQQLSAVGKYTKNIIMLYDGDIAGMNATKRGIELALKHGFHVSVISLPNNEDPDSFIRKNSSEVFGSYIRNARPFIDFLATMFRDSGAMASSKTQAEAIRTIVTYVSYVHDKLEQDILLRSVASTFGVPESLLYQEFSSITGKSITPQTNNKLIPFKQKYSQFQNGKWKNTNQNSNPNDLVDRTIPQLQTTSKSAIRPEEKELLRLALVSPVAFTLLDTTYHLAPEHFISSHAQELYRVILHAHHHGVEVVGHVLSNETLSQELRDIASTLVFEIQQPSENWRNFDVEILQPDTQKTVYDNVLQLRLSHVKQEIGFIQIEIKQTPEDQAQLQILLQKLIELQKSRLHIEYHLRGGESSIM